MNELVNVYIHAEKKYNIRWLRIFYKLWFKIQLSTWAGARNPETESGHNTEPAVAGGTGGCRLSPAVSPAPTMPAPRELLVLSEDKF